MLPSPVTLPCPELVIVDTFKAERLPDRVLDWSLVLEPGLPVILPLLYARPVVGTLGGSFPAGLTPLPRMGGLTPLPILLDPVVVLLATSPGLLAAMRAAASSAVLALPRALPLALPGGSGGRSDIVINSLQISVM